MNIDDEIMYKQIGARLKTQRRDIGITQIELARQVEVSRTSVTNIEAGLQKLPLHLLYRICSVLQLEASEVLPSVKEVTVEKKETVEYDDGRSQEMSPSAASFVREVLEDITEDDQ